MAQELLKIGRGRESRGGEIRQRIKGLRETFSDGAGVTRTATPLNGSNGPHRAVDWAPVPLERIKRMSRALECTVNDVVLTIVTGAFREYLLHTDFVPGSAPFRATVPVSIWGDRDKSEVGNQIMTWMIDLPVGHPDPRAQLRAIHRVTNKLKKSDRALGVKMLESFLRYTPGLVSLAVRNAAGPTNTLVTNIPGPQMALYQMGVSFRRALPGFDDRAWIIIVYTGFWLPMSIWIAKGFFDAVPRELEEAALVDGCSPAGAFLRITLRVAAPGLTAVFLLTYVGVWNEFLAGYLLISKNALKPAMFGMYDFLGQNLINAQLVAAACVIVALPMVIVFLFARKTFFMAMTEGAVKG